MDGSTALNALAALSHEHRFAVYRLLMEAGDKGAAAGVISATIGVAPSSLTFHLQQLQRAGLVIQRRSGRNLIYNANVETSQRLVGYLAATCCTAPVEAESRAP
jgi:DNA-binding transcriptional ArsR family regulator